MTLTGTFCVLFFSLLSLSLVAGSMFCQSLLTVLFCVDLTPMQDFVAGIPPLIG